MKCEYCGRTISSSAQFCTNCGHSTEETGEAQKSGARRGSAFSAYAVSILLMLIIISALVLAGMHIVYTDLHPAAEVSQSDSTGGGSGIRTDLSVIGSWVCEDPAAADYTSTDYGKSVHILLTIAKGGGFTLDYAMSDAGVPAIALTVSGRCITGDGRITFSPDNAAGAEKYLRKHGDQPSFPYTVEGDRLTLEYENGAAIVFTRRTAE